MSDAYQFEDTGDADSLARHVQKLRSNLKSRDSSVKLLKSIALLLEACPQDLASLGSARKALEQVLIDKSIVGSKHKDVKTFAAACMAHMLRIYAPETPYEDSQLRDVFDLLLWSVKQLADYQSPMFETALSVVQTINQTRSYFLLLDLGAEDAVLEWVRALLQCINPGSSAMAGTQVMELLQGLIADESTDNAVLELLLSHLVPPRSLENPHACEVAQAVLKACEADIKPQLQKYLTTLILSPISSNSDLQHQCYTLIYQLYQSIPHVLLPVVPHLTSELQSSDGTKRLEAVQLLSKLFSLPGSKLVTDYGDVLDALLGRYQDTKIEVRLTMLESTNALVAGVGSGDLQQKVLNTAATRLQDFEEKVRVAAVKCICQTSRRLLVGPTSIAPGSTGPAADYVNDMMLTTPPGELLGQLGSQEDDAAEAADLGVEYTPPDVSVPLAGVGPEAHVRDVAYVHQVLQRISLRLRDTKFTVRKAAANGLLSVFRAVAAAGDADQLAKVCWLPNRIILCMKSDAELRTHIIESAMKDGLLGPQVPAAQTAAAWVQLWLTASQLEKEALLLTLNLRMRAQGEALVLLTLRRKAAGKDKDDSDSLKQRLDAAAKRLAQCLPHPDKAIEGLNVLMAVRDNHAFSALQQALSPEVPLQAFSKARSDALARVGSRSPAADFITHLLLWARPAAWLPTPVLSAMLDLITDDPNGPQGNMVREAYIFMQKLAKTTPLLFTGLMPQLLRMLHSNEADLQLLSTHLLARFFVQQRKLGLPAMTSSANEATASLVGKQLMPCLRQLARGQSCRVEQQQAGVTTASHHKHMQHSKDSEDQADDLQIDGSPVTVAVGVAAPKAAKWAVYALATCQDSSSCRKELSQLAVELAGSLDSSAAETAAKLQALSAIGRILPDAFAPHVEAMMSFVLDDYLLSYLDASITNPTSISLSPSSRSPLGIPGDSSVNPQLAATQVPGVAAVWLKAGAVKALAAGCVPDSDSSDLPMETTRAVARLAPRLEGYLEPGEDARPEFLADVSAEVAGVLRLAAASALLRLARRHDSRMNSSCYSMLALVMQDDLEGVRAAFSAKVYKLMRHFQVRPSTHQLGAKYAAMLPLGAMDPSRANKETAGRQLREWVHSRRAAVQQQITAAAAAANGGAMDGGSTLQDLPEMVIPYCLYILAHHPDFPQDEDTDQAQCYDPFQFMLHFMLQPLLVASGSTSAGATIPAIVKMCHFLKKTADISEDSCTNQLYILCDMTIAIAKGLAETMSLDTSLVSGHYPGSITLPKGLYRPLDKDERIPHAVSYLPPGFQVTLDPEPATALAHPPGQTAAPTTGAAKGRQAGAASKRRAQQHRAATVQHKKDQADDPSPSGTRSKAGWRAATKRAPVESDDGWESDEGSEDAPPSAQKAAKDQQLTKRQHALQQQRGAEQQSVAQELAGKKHKLDPEEQSQHKHKRQRQQQQRHEEDAVSHDDPGQEQQQESNATQPLEQLPAVGQHKQQHKQAHGKQQQNGKLKQQPLTAAFNKATLRQVIADASSPAPAKGSRRRQVSAPQPTSPASAAAAAECASAGGQAAADSAEEQTGGGSGAEAPAQNGMHNPRNSSLHSGAEEGSNDSQGVSARKRQSSRVTGAAPGVKGGATASIAAGKRPPAKSGGRAKGSPDTRMPDQQPSSAGLTAGRGARSGGAAAGAARGVGAASGKKKTSAPAASGGGRTTRRRAVNA